MLIVLLYVKIDLGPESGSVRKDFFASVAVVCRHSKPLLVNHVPPSEENCKRPLLLMSSNHSHTYPTSLLLLFCVTFPKTQAVCYLGLWVVSGNHPPEESQDAGHFEGSNDFSILAVSGAMYLLLSIAAADLWGGSALVLEKRGSRTSRPWFWWRKAFGLFLLGTFVTLIGASIRVLFYSSYENVELVIGAAAVLFIADVVSETSLAVAI